mmetsp:Transcript_4054/g.10015  ORF Transcript_4054/g.10015 Transcript_4054/m.10015 type:complete len:167 (+) Transcript_4054:1605-2105(+)
MDKAKSGHEVEFHDLKGAALFNGKRGTLIKFISKEQRLAVRLHDDEKTNNAGSKVCAKPSNLTLVKIDKKKNITSGADHPNASWAIGLSTPDQYKWFCNCYQLRCDDDYQYGGRYLHGPYNPDIEPRRLMEDFLVYCFLAHKSHALPFGWDWVKSLEAGAPKCIPT